MSFDGRVAESSRLPHNIEEFKYRSEANRFDSDFVFKKAKKSESVFFKTKGKKRKGSIVNYRSFAIPKQKIRMNLLCKYSKYRCFQIFKKKLLSL